MPSDPDDSAYLSHNDFAGLLLALGYQGTKCGVCAGITGMVNQAIVIGELDVFLARLRFIASNGQSVAKELYDYIHNNKPLPKEEKRKGQLVDCLALFDGVSLYQSPFLHEELLQKHSSQARSIEDISPIVGNKALERAGGLHTLYLNHGIYTQNEFAAYVSDLSEQLKGLNNIAVSIGGSDHALTVVYENNAWRVIDVNVLDSVNDRFSNDNLVEIIPYLLSRIEESHFPLLVSTKILSTGKSVKESKNDLSERFSTLNAKSYHQVDEGRAQLIEVGSGMSLLHRAVNDGAYSLVKELLETGADVDLMDKDKISPLIIAVRQSDLTVARLLLTYGADVNLADKYGKPPLAYAAYFNDRLMAQLLLNNGANINAVDDYGYTVLHYVCKGGLIDMLEVVTEHDAKLNLPDNKGRTPLFFALEKEQWEMADALLELDVVVETEDENGMSALAIAIGSYQFGLAKKMISKGAQLDPSNPIVLSKLFTICELGLYKDMLKLLIESKINLNQLRADDGKSALSLACEFNNEVEVSLLIDGGANVNQFDRSGNYPLFRAASLGHEKVVKLLLEAGAKIDIPSEGMPPPLFIACQNGHLSVVKHLVGAGAKFFERRLPWGAPFLSACLNNRDSIIDYCLEQNQDSINVGNHELVTPLFIACQAGNLSATQKIISIGANVNLRMKGNISPLMIASVMGHIDIVQALLTQKANLNATIETDDNAFLTKFYKKHRPKMNTHYQGASALWLAASLGYESVVRLLVETGADLNQTNWQGHSPLFLTFQLEQLDLAEYLISKGARLTELDIEVLSKDLNQSDALKNYAQTINKSLGDRPKGVAGDNRSQRKRGRGLPLEENVRISTPGRKEIDREGAYQRLSPGGRDDSSRGVRKRGRDSNTPTPGINESKVRIVGQDLTEQAVYSLKQRSNKLRFMLGKKDFFGIRKVLESLFVRGDIKALTTMLNDIHVNSNTIFSVRGQLGSALMHGARQGDLALVKELLANTEIDVNMYYEQQSPFTCALESSQNRAQLIESLLEHGLQITPYMLLKAKATLSEDSRSLNAIVRAFEKDHQATSSPKKSK